MKTILRNASRRFLPVSAAAAAMFLTASCDHKELCFDHTHIVPVEVVFDWSDAPEANPASMATYFYDSEGGRQRIIIAGKEGGRIMLPIGDYSAIATNSDDTDWAGIRNDSDIETIESFTADVSVLAGGGYDTQTLPRARSTESERIAAAPGMLWSARTDGFRITPSDTLRRIIFTPSEAICHYRVIVSDVENLRFLRGAVIDATLTGMSEGYNHGRQQPADTRVTLPFTLSPEQDDMTVLTASFLTFGESPRRSFPHILTIYLTLDDGTRWYQSFDVTEQVSDAPDPRHVTIRLDGLTLPRPIVHDEGFHPDVNEWQSIEVDLNM